MSIALSHLPGLIRRGVLAAGVVASMLIAPRARHTLAAGAPLPIGAPCMPAGHGPGVIPSISFGRKFGNIRPFTVAIYADGTIAYHGITPVVPNYAILPDAVLGLERLADAEGFGTWPPKITATHLLPDLATLFVTLRAGCSPTTRTVNLQGGASLPSFSQLFATLEAATVVRVPPMANPGPPAAGY